MCMLTSNEGAEECKHKDHGRQLVAVLTVGGDGMKAETGSLQHAGKPYPCLHT
jgi:hypothetical protein